MNQLKENLIWIALGIPGMVLIGLVLHSLVHFETGVLVITSMILGTLLMVFCEALCKAAHAMEGIDDDYDYAIIDCPPSLGLVTRNAMVAADELIVPVIPNRSSLKGFTNIQKCVNSVRRNKRLNPNLRIAGIVVNMFDGRTSLSRGVVNELPSIARAANTKMFHTIIRKCEAVNKAQSANVSIFDYDPNCNAVADFTDFVNEYLEGEDY